MAVDGVLSLGSPLESALRQIGLQL